MWFGAASEDLSQKEAEALGWKKPRGVRVTNLTAGGPAESAGLETGDILVAIGGAEIPNDDGFSDAILAKTPGTLITLSVLRAGAEKQISVMLVERPIRRADASPQLVLDTGGHMANVVDTAFTPDGKQLVSASNDKTVRVWDIATGKTVRMIRGESAPGNWGTIYAMSLSRDGRWLAIAGFLSEADVISASAVHLYDFASGKLVKILKGHRNVVFALAFSPDGKRLVSGGSDKSAIIWDVATGRQLIRLRGHSDTIEAVGFSKDGSRVVTGSGDETIRLWKAGDGKLIAEMTEHRSITQRQNKDSKVWSGNVKTVAFSPNDRMIASGSADGRVLLWDGDSGAFLRELAFPGGMVGGAAIDSLSFSPDGKVLLFSSAMEGCQFLDVASGKELWDGKLLDKPESRFFSSVKRPDCTGGAAFSPDGQFAAASYNNIIRILDARTGRVTNTLQGVGATVFGTGFAKDGRSIAWGTDLPSGAEFPPLNYRLNLPLGGLPLGGPERIAAVPTSAPPSPKPADGRPRLSMGLDADKPRQPTDDNYLRRNPKHGPLSAEFKHLDKMLINTRLVEISNQGQVQTKIELDGDGGKHGTLGFMPDGQAILLGRANEIQTYDLKGRRLDGFTGHLGTVRDHAPSADGRFLVSGGSDQTVRLWNLRTRELIVSLFYGSDGEWVIWTPQGYYASSPNGDRIVGWQINKGPDQPAEYVTASQLRSKFYRPDIVERAIVLASASEALGEGDPAHVDGFQLSDLAQRLPPKLSVVNARDRGATSNGRTVIEVALAETSGDPVDSFKAFVNDTKVTATAKRNGGNVSFEIPLAKGNNRIRLVARSKSDLLGEAQVDIVQRGEGALDMRNTLFIVAIGADKYPLLPKRCGPSGDARCDLAFAGADAKAFAATIEKQMGGQHKRVVKKILVNGAGGELEPTRANVENVLATLLQAKDNDTVAVFIAGHGLNDARTGYQYLPSDAAFNNGPELAPASVIKWSVLEEAIQSAKGRRLLFVDTCRSTNAFNPRLMKDASDDAIVAFSATNTQQDALELADLGHGVFTAAVVKGLNGAADIAQEQEVRVFDLGTYVEREVRKLTRGLQTPDFYKKPGAENFVLARLTNATAALPPEDEQKTLSDLKATSRDDRPAALGLPPEQPAMSPLPAPEIKPAVAVSAAPEDNPALPAAAAEAPGRQADPPAVQVPTQVGAASRLVISPGEEAERLKSGQAAMALDDIGAARLIFEYLATRGSAAGAYRLAQTYDPQILGHTPMGALVKPDEQIAESWYSKAAELGYPEARKNLSVKK